MNLPRHCEIWLPGYIQNRLESRHRNPPRNLWLTFADHYEPLWARADEKTGLERVMLWHQKWPEIAYRFAEAAGDVPRYTFFFPQEEYRPQLMEPLQRLAEKGIADVEVHLHHDGEGEQDFIDRISSFTETLSSSHGLLRKVNGKPAFGFIHGLWALDNSRPDGRWCGLNNEITLLRDLGCYADFTMPSGASPTQSRIVNTIYWATDDPEKRKSYASGRPVMPGDPATGDLLMIPGPFGLRWGERLVPRLETGELACYNPPSRGRARSWLALAPRIGEDAFLKLHTHGTQERHSALLLNGGLDRTLQFLSEECRRLGCRLHFASAWEMRQVVDAARQPCATPEVTASMSGQLAE